MNEIIPCCHANTSYVIFVKFIVNLPNYQKNLHNEQKK